MGRVAIAVGLAIAAGCDSTPATEGSGGADATGEDGSTGGPATTSADTATTATSSASSTTTASDSGPTNPTTDPTDSPTTTDPTASESGSDTGTTENGWIEIGHGLDEFFPFEDELPLTLGPQGFMMFSLPLRGSGFPVPADPFDFDHPDTPVLSVWTDIEGIPSDHPSGHFAAYLDYPVPFSLSDEEGVDYEFISVWLVIPKTYAPAELAGREAIVHAELATSDGQVLLDDHTLTVLDATVGEGEGDGS